jgi:hypothetical protein
MPHVAAAVPLAMMTEASGLILEHVGHTDRVPVDRRLARGCEVKNWFLARIEAARGGRERDEVPECAQMHGTPQ